MNFQSIVQPIVFIDLETTGANFERDRILEIGLVELSESGGSEWSTLVSSEIPISDFITSLTGIDDQMVVDAPIFSEIADELRDRLNGKLLVAHNARFDYGFLKAEFSRIGIEFRSNVLCTVKLSRKLSPKAHRHNLDTLIERYAIPVGARHRALADAQVLWHLWHAWRTEFGTAALEQAVVNLVRPVELPEHLDPALADELPEAAGAYALIDAMGIPLRVGRTSNLRNEVLGLFSDRRATTGVARQTRHVRWNVTAGEFGARIAEIGLRRLAQVAPIESYSWRLTEIGPGDYRPTLVSSTVGEFGVDDNLYGLYSTEKEARHALRKMAEAHFLCLRVLGLEHGKPDGSNAACSATRTKQCRGACTGKEDISRHSARLMTAFAKQKLNKWPFSGPVAVVERDSFGMREDFHIFDCWSYFGVAKSEQEAFEKLENRNTSFDADMYRCLAKHLQSARLRVIDLQERYKLK
jgi:DNA polymerase-3 subunit epsilon